jgi:ferredoxin--NADP+ reductase
MFKVTDNKELNQQVISLTIEAPLIARKAKAGQFVAVVLNESGERIPLTLADWDKEKGLIKLIFQKVGFTTKQLARLDINDNIMHILGPLGHATEIKNFGEVFCVGGGVGIAEVYPVARALKEAGNRIVGVLGARNKDLLILEEDMRKTCDELFCVTDDGSNGHKGIVTDVLKELFNVIEKSTHTQYPGLVYCIGPVPMMKAVAELTIGYGIKTVASINPIMVDATGMCGACRCHVGGKTVFGCVDGPDFDAHKIDFDELNQRLRAFKDQEEGINR